MNGFIACRSDEIIPEFYVPDRQEPAHGAIIWEVEDGVKRKAAVFDGKSMKFKPYKND